MKGKKFEWFTYEDTMGKALMLNARMMDFLSKTNIKFFFMDSEIEICNLGFREGELKTDPSFNSYGYVYLDDKDQSKFEKVLKRKLFINKSGITRQS